MKALWTGDEQVESGYWVCNMLHAPSCNDCLPILFKSSTFKEMTFEFSGHQKASYRTCTFKVESFSQAHRLGCPSVPIDQETCLLLVSFTLECLSIKPAV